MISLLNMTKPVFITDLWGFNHFEFGNIHVRFEFNKTKHKSTLGRVDIPSNNPNAWCVCFPCIFVEGLKLRSNNRNDNSIRSVKSTMSVFVMFHIGSNKAGLPQNQLQVSL